jgi:hypothetical protein
MSPGPLIKQNIITTSSLLLYNELQKDNENDSLHFHTRHHQVTENLVLKCCSFDLKCCSILSLNVAHLTSTNNKDLHPYGNK